MRPGQLEPNEFEMALLKHFAAQDPALLIDGLHVLSRKFTGVGSFTNFLCHGSAEVKWDRTVDLDATIVMPGVPNGLGAVLFCTGRHPNMLEIYTYGSERWEGLYDGFALRESA
jgi:hypothetical protein